MGALVKPSGHMGVRVPLFFNFLYLPGGQGQPVLTVGIDVKLKGDAFCSQTFGKAQGILDRDRGIPGSVPYESRRCLRIYVRFQTIVSRPRRIPLCRRRIRPCRIPFCRRRI